MKLKLTWLIKAFRVIIAIVLIFTLWRVFIADKFIVSTSSMEPTLKSGDRILVVKTIYGARIYKDYGFHDNMDLKCTRTIGCRELRRNDIVVFNYPRNGDGTGDGISFKINYVFTKRCIGLPGDSISAENGFWRNSNYSGILGVIEQQETLSRIPLELISPEVNNVVRPPEFNWTVKDFGPLYVPKKGDAITVNEITKALYGVIFKYENHDAGEDSHVFVHDYYFMAGDNVCNSGDSRYWGFVPDDYIVGVVKAVLFNRDQESGKRDFKRFRLL